MNKLILSYIKDEYKENLKLQDSEKYNIQYLYIIFNYNAYNDIYVAKVYNILLSLLKSYNNYIQSMSILYLGQLIKNIIIWDNKLHNNLSSQYLFTINDERLNTIYHNSILSLAKDNIIDVSQPLVIDKLLLCLQLKISKLQNVKTQLTWNKLLDDITNMMIILSTLDNVIIVQQLINYYILIVKTLKKIYTQSVITTTAKFLFWTNCDIYKRFYNTLVQTSLKDKINSANILLEM